MHTLNIIERAFQLASESTSLEDIRKTLRGEGYSNVDAHLAGASIRADLKKRFAQPAAVDPGPLPLCSDGPSFA